MDHPSWEQAAVPPNIFFALRAPLQALGAIETVGGTVRRAHRLRGRPILGERLHATLAPIAGSVLQNWLARAADAAARVRHDPFPVRFDRIGSFDVRRTRYPLVLRGEEGLCHLVEFEGEPCAAFKRAGFAAAGSFTPHITLLWADRAIEDHPIAPIGWTVTDFVLVSSVVGQSRHIVLGHWQLP